MTYDRGIYIGLAVILIAQMLFKANKKEFTFNV
jgi:hypothetical protein